MKDLIERLKQALSRREVCRITGTGMPSAAVLIPISYNDCQYYILFTRRTQSVKHHKGEMSFPGGVYEETDGTLVGTALRESFEEIGLAPADVEVLGQLDDTATKSSKIVITPFVALIPSPYKFSLNTHETDELIEIRINALLDKACLNEERVVNASGETSIDLVYQYGRVSIIGATSRILKQFLEIFSQVISHTPQANHEE